MNATIRHNPRCSKSRGTLAAMVADLILIGRPLVETAEGVRLCRPPEKVREIM